MIGIGDDMLKIITDILWSIAIVFLLGGGLYFSIKLGFPQLKLRSLFSGFKTDDKTNVGITVYDNTGTSYNPSYADYANHDFTVKSEDLKSSKTGDPRWIK